MANRQVNTSLKSQPGTKRLVQMWIPVGKLVAEQAVPVSYTHLDVYKRQIGHSQFERIPLSFERQERIIQEQIYETLAAINELKVHAGENLSLIHI